MLLLLLHLPALNNRVQHSPKSDCNHHKCVHSRRNVAIRMAIVSALLLDSAQPAAAANALVFCFTPVFTVPPHGAFISGCGNMRCLSKRLPNTVMSGMQPGSTLNCRGVFKSLPAAHCRHWTGRSRIQAHRWRSVTAHHCLTVLQAEPQHRKFQTVNMNRLRR